MGYNAAVHAGLDTAWGAVYAWIVLAARGRPVISTWLLVRYVKWLNGLGAFGLRGRRLATQK